MKARVFTLLSLVPALGLITLLFGASLVYGVSQSLGYLPFIGQETVSLAAYAHVLVGPSVAHTEFWHSLGFSLWVSGAATLLSALFALLGITLIGERLRTSRGSLMLLQLNLAFPHLVWAIGLSLLLAQSGLLARIAALLGLIDAPAEFPVLVRDRAGFGIILHYVTKGTPFLILLLLSVLRSQTEAYHIVAENLGANRWQRLRYVTLPLVLPGLTAGSLLIFAFVFGSYEVPALLGVRFPRMLSVLALEFFRNADLGNRAEGMAISVIMTLVVLVIAAGIRIAYAVSRSPYCVSRILYSVVRSAYCVSRILYSVFCSFEFMCHIIRLTSYASRFTYHVSRLTHYALRTTHYVLRLTFHVLLLAPIGIFLLHAFAVRWFYPQVLPTELTAEPFLRQLGMPQTQAALVSSLQIGVLSSGLALLVGYPAARTLGLREFPGKGIVFLLVFLPTVMPPVAIGIGLNILFLRLGLAGTLLGVTLVHMIPVLPYVIFTLASLFARYDLHFEQQARVLGAGPVRIFFSVTLPLILPGIVVATLFAFLVSWSQYLLTLLIGGGQVMTLPILLFATISGGNPTTISVLALLFVAPPILFILLTARYLAAEGLGVRG